MNGTITQILAGYGITPNFSGSPYVPVGEQVKLSIDWQATADASNWTSAVVAYVPGTWEILDEETERHVSPSASGNVKLNLMNMTAAPITIAVVLWGNPDYLLKNFPADGGNWVQLAYQTITVLPGAGEIKYRSFRMENLTVIPSDRVIAEVSVEHQGKGESGELFIETNGENNKVDWVFPNDVSWTRHYKTIDLDISELGAGSYDLEIKLQSVAGPDWFINLPDAFVISYMGQIISKVLSIAGGSSYNIPVSTVLPLNTKASIKVITRNTGSIKYHPCIVWEVRDKDNVVVTDYAHCAFDMASPGEESTFFEAVETFILRKAGNYTLQIWLQTQEAQKTIAYWSGKLCTVVGDGEPPECTIDADCPDGYVCRNGVCVLEEEPVTCLVDADCPEGYICKDGKCVKEGKEGEFPWLPVALITGGVIITIAAVAPRRGKPKA